MPTYECPIYNTDLSLSLCLSQKAHHNYNLVDASVELIFKQVINSKGIAEDRKEYVHDINSTIYIELLKRNFIYYRD